MRHKLNQLIPQRVDRRFLLYIVAFIAVSSVPTWYVYHLMFHSAVMVGADPANHTVFAKQVVESMNVLFPVAQFYPDNPGSGYYPLFPAVIIAILHLITRIDIIEIFKFFMFFTFIGGQIGYALLSIKIANNNLNKGLFIYLVISFSTALLIKTLRDGSYGEIFAFWFLLPLFLYCLLGRRLIWSALLLAFIFASNIPATFGISILVLAFLLFYLVGREWSKVKFTLKVVLVAAVVASPVLYYTYFLMAIRTTQGNLEAYPISVLHIGNAFPYIPLFAIASICMVVILIFYQQYRWIALWTALYVLIIISPFLSGLYERFLREMTVPLSLAIGIVFYDGTKLVAKKMRNFSLCGTFKSETQLRIVLLLLAAIVIISIGITPLSKEANPVVTDYFTQMKLEAYQWLNDETAGQEVGVVTISTMDPWAKVYVNSRIWEVLSPSLSSRSLSAHDKAINDDLVQGLLFPSQIDNLLKRNIAYIILSAPMPDRWYETDNKEFANELINGISSENEPHYKLVYYIQTDVELIKIYRIESEVT